MRYTKFLPLPSFPLLGGVRGGFLLPAPCSLLPAPCSQIRCSRLLQEVY
ncbi:MAG: hypothetical protein F6K50_05465 [Moorea sp. SIO3I7]|nr:MULTISPECIES: hypothetical protein [unclassified Moorena]NEN94995.1 hypothetical protein [Moorena sp. SIO3I7]NEO10149.1 hypothetical protein [Moorena sp. SIO3I8]NEQ59028.1 hypothetical protein [Moorena sp. SIO4A1]